MYCLLLFGAAALGLGALSGRGAVLGCRPLKDYCWVTNTSIGVSCCGNVDFCATSDPVQTAVAFLNDCSIIAKYRGKKVYLQDMLCYKNKTYLLFVFDDGEHIAFEVERGSCCPCDCSWRVSRYCYVDL